ncbi:MAG: hypothetical protein ACOYLQ_02770 [Hyphomicrobiaceae bacterium]
MSRLLWLTGLAVLVAPHAVWAEDVTLRMRGGDYELRGQLVAHDGKHFVVVIPSVGRVALRADRFDCTSAGCPGVSPRALVVARAEPRRPRERR